MRYRGTVGAYRTAQRDALSGRVRTFLGSDGVKTSGSIVMSGLIPPSSRESCYRVQRHRRGGVTLAGDVTVGSECRVEAGATGEQSVLLPSSSVGVRAYLEDCVVGPDCEVRLGE